MRERETDFDVSRGLGHTYVDVPLASRIGSSEYSLI